MNERGFVYKVVKNIESKFSGVISYAYLDFNINKTYRWWCVCIDNYELYTSAEFRNFANNWQKLSKKINAKIVFVYCIPKEKKLIELSENNNLIMNV